MIQEDYYEAIAFFQKYPDQWAKLMNGIKAKRNQGFDEAAGYLFSRDTHEREVITLGIMHRMTGFDEILRDFVGAYPEKMDEDTTAEKGNALL